MLCFIQNFIIISIKFWQNYYGFLNHINKKNCINIVKSHEDSHEMTENTVGNTV